MPDTPIVLDSGCSVSITPHLEDFVGDLRNTNDKEMHGLSDSVEMQGEGVVEWTIRDVHGNVGMVRTRAYYMPTARMRLCSTQTYFQENKHSTCSLHQTHEKVTLTTAEGETLTFPYNPSSNLPLMFMDVNLTRAGLTKEQVLNLTHEDNSDLLLSTMSLLDKNNHNLSAGDKELLLWHNRVSHAGFSWVQSLMHKKKNGVGDDPDPPVIPTKTTTAARCDPPKCPACQLSKQQRRSHKSARTHVRPSKDMSSRRLM